MDVGVMHRDLVESAVGPYSDNDDLELNVDGLRGRTHLCQLIRAA